MIDDQALDWRNARVIPGPKAEILSDLAAVVADLERVDQILAACLDQFSETALAQLDGSTLASAMVLKSALIESAIIAYARCFATGRRERLRPEDIYRDRPQGQESHRLFITFRSKHIAHAVNAMEQAAVLALIGDETEMPVKGLGPVVIRLQSFGDENLVVLQKLTRHARAVLQPRIAAQVRELLSDVRNLSTEELAALPENGFSVGDFRGDALHPRR